MLFEEVDMLGEVCVGMPPIVPFEDGHVVASTCCKSTAVVGVHAQIGIRVEVKEWKGGLFFVLLDDLWGFVSGAVVSDNHPDVGIHFLVEDALQGLRDVGFLVVAAQYYVDCKTVHFVKIS